MKNKLIHIGYRKAASTFLRDWFFFHPSLHLQPYSQEPDLAEVQSNDYLVFSEAFLLFRGNDRPRTIENLQQFQREKCRELKAKFPTAKILLIARSPEKSIVSEYSEYIKNGGMQTFDSMKNDPLHQAYFLGHYNYNFVIELYTNAFGKESVLVLPMELLQDRPTQFIKELETFLDVPHVEFAHHKRNSSRTPNQLWAFRMISLFVWRMTAVFGKKRKGIYYVYMRYLEKESYTNKKLAIPIKLLLLFKWKKEPVFEVPRALLIELKNQAQCLQTFPYFDSYSNEYFNT